LDKKERVDIIAAILASGYVVNTVNQQECAKEVLNIFFDYREILQEKL